MWLVVHKHCLTADNLKRKGWPHNSTCSLCQATNEDCNHLFIHCRFSRQVWLRFREWTKEDFLIPSDDFHTMEEWWLQERGADPKVVRRDFDTITILVHWRIWKERNRRIFRQEFSSPKRVFELILEDVRAWKATGCVTGF
jgi:hypothetical protein